MSSSPLVLITAGNGFVGYAVLAGTLKAGVRASSESITVVVHVIACFWSTSKN